MADADPSLVPPPTNWRRPGGPIAPFQYDAFRSIWLAMLLCNFGTMIQGVSAAWLMTDLTRSHLLVALIQASNTIPVMFIGVLAGAIADNFDRRRIMLASQVLMLVASFALAGLTWWGLISPYILLSMTLLLGVATALNGPAWQASIRMQVGPQDVPQAVALNAISFNLARSVGPSLGGLIISIWSPEVGFALNAVSYIAIIVVLSRWRPQVTPMDRRPVLPAIAEGLRFAFTSKPISKILLRGAVFGSGAAAMQSLLPLVAKAMPGGTAITYGVLLGGFGIGSIVMAFFIGQIRRRTGSETVMVASCLAVAVGLLGVGHLHSLPLATAAAFIAGAGWTSAMTSVNVAVQLRAPEWILGRSMSIYQATAFGGMAIGAYTWGTLADHIGLEATMTCAAAWLVVTLVLHWVAPMPTRDEGRVDPLAPAPGR